jgi:hypothetical protein
MIEPEICFADLADDMALAVSKCDGSVWRHFTWSISSNCITVKHTVRV